MNIGVVIPVGAGRDENLRAVLESISGFASRLTAIVLVEDGCELDVEGPGIVKIPMLRKHQPGQEQPRNVGVRWLTVVAPETTHVWFLDSDVIVAPNALDELLVAYSEGPQDRTLVLPYVWLPPGIRPEMGPHFWSVCNVDNDPRRAMLHSNTPARVFEGDLSAGLACFSGNLVWNIDQFKRVGGFWSELHHGRCEDGELGLRAVAMEVPISVSGAPCGYHLWHEINMPLAIERNARDVPMINERHPWVEGAGVFMVDRDGKAFDVLCAECSAVVPTIGWWEHAATHETMAIPRAC